MTTHPAQQTIKPSNGQTIRPQPLRLLTTKLYAPPPRPGLVTRPRLLAALGQGLRPGCKLILVSASAGFGKTTAVTDWLYRDRPYPSYPYPSYNKGSQTPPEPVGTETVPAHVTWLSLDGEDNDPARFFAYFIAAWQQVEPTIGQGLQLSPKLPPVETLVTTLINDIADLPQTALLVLDDYHLIQNDHIHEALALFLEHLPPHIHVTLTTREDPPLPLPRLRVRGQMVELRQDDLRFTAAEAVAFLEQTMGLNLPAGAIATLEARTEGWIAGLQLAAISMQGRDRPALTRFIDAFSGSDRYVIDYLVEEVIQQQPPAVRQFLTETAILERMSAPLCDAVTGRADSKEMLTDLEHANLFLIPLDDKREWYRYHHLFAEFLRTELAPAEQTAGHRRAARWFERHDLLPEAIKHTLLAADTEEAGRLIRQAAADALRRGEFTTLEGWLAALPPQMIEADPELTAFKGWLLWMLGQGEAAAQYAAQAEATLTADTSRRSRGRLKSLQALLALGGQGEEGLQLAREALALIDKDDIFFRSITLLVIGEVLGYVGDTVSAIEVFQETLDLGRRINEPFMILGAGMNLAQQWNWQGRRRQAVALCHDLIEQFDKPGGKPFPLVAVAYCTLAEMEYYANHLDEAQRYMTRSLDLGQQQHFMLIDISAKMTLAPIQDALGETEKALDSMRDLHQLIYQSNFQAYMPIFKAFEARYQLKLENLTAAAQWAATANLSAADTPTPVRGIEYFVYVRLLLAQNRLAEADTLLTKLADLARSRKRTYFLIEALVLQAVTYAMLEDETRALATLTEALQWAAPETYRCHFLNGGPVIAALLPNVRPVAPDFVDSLLAAFAEQEITPAPPPPAPSPPAPQPLIEPLSERELELLALIGEGYSNRQVAEALVITVGTVKKHLNNIFGKLEAKNRTQAVARARELGLLS